MERGTFVSLKIFGKDGPKKDGGGGFSEDVVGRFRSGHQVESGKGKKKPIALSEWRVTTGDPDVATRVQELLGGDEAAEWDATGEDNLEVFTEAPEVEILLEKASSLRQAMILWGRNGNIIRKSDGETISYPEESKGDPDPQADQSLQERKAAAKEGTGAEPQIEVYFRLAEDPDLGIWKFQSGSWSLVSDLAYNETQEEIEEIFADGADAVRATLRLEEVSFEAKNGPMAGKTVTFTKPVLENVRAAE
jgi:hypothetical protein